MTRDDLDNLGSLITLKGQNACLGSLMDFGERGVYDAEYGRIDGLTPAEAATHNELLDQALIEGLDTRCAVGQGGNFYLKVLPHHCEVHTFTGKVVADSVVVTGAKRRTLGFTRAGRRYKAAWPKDGDLIFVKRVG